MGFNNKAVSIRVDKEFFDKMFEPSRRNMEKTLGTKVTQERITKMIFKSGINFNPVLQKFIKTNGRNLPTVKKKFNI